ncbi:hypothetical protein MtrunA17_Chr2g0296311 [Medicago truncatula]|uniref:Uncharacterized protein n=1 Tax=Medicago truncatula TaxID=3880 RepID=A0A396J564_MEDTR|nr:hypothetical protein MtrunA17_Chr2g0296311 [Medicago truncatula]
MLTTKLDFKLFNHNCKILPMLLNTIKRLLLLMYKCKRLLNSNRITKKIV